MGFLIGLNILLALAGCILPIPSLVLSLREWLRIRSAAPPKPWRRVVSHIALSILILGMILWVYAAIRQLRGDFSYIVPSASIGRWTSVGLIVLCAFAESKLRRYLLLGALGMLFFFGCTIGDWTI
jgi:hypothetical protein